MLYLQLGWASLVALVVLVLMMPIQVHAAPARHLGFCHCCFDCSDLLLASWVSACLPHMKRRLLAVGQCPSSDCLCTL